MTPFKTNDIEDDSSKPEILFAPPTFRPRQQAPAPASASAPDIASASSNTVGSSSKSQPHRRHIPHALSQHVRLQTSKNGTKSPASSIYFGSYGHGPRRSQSVQSFKTRGSSAPPSPRSMSHRHPGSLSRDLDVDLETYGFEELRDGFFDGAFFKPPKVDREELHRVAEQTLPATYQKKHPLSPRHFLPTQWHEIKGVVRVVVTTRAGIKLSKSFLAFFIAYVLCLIPVIRFWLGRYSYIMVLSTVINHPGRSLGAQIDGLLLTSIGTATGLGWGAFALWLSDSTSTAKKWYGGTLALFLVVFMGIIAALRSYYVRVYQLVLCAGIAVIYTCLADTSEEIAWGKLFDYGIPWLFGQAICILICCAIFPDAGSRPLAVALHNAFEIMQGGLILPHPNSVANHRALALTFVNLSEAYRDLALDVSITRFQPPDVMALRNLIQAVIRSLLSLKMDSELFDKLEDPDEDDGDAHADGSGTGNSLSTKNNIPACNDEVVIDMDGTNQPMLSRSDTGEQAVKLVTNKLSRPTSALLSCIRSSLERCDAVLMSMSGYRRYLGPPEAASSDIIDILTKLRKFMIKYDEAEDSLMNNPALPSTYSNHPEVVELFLFVHPIRQTAKSVEALLVKVMEMQQRHPGWRMHLPSYPFLKGMQRTNAQVRHDRGGVTAGFYFRSQTQLARTMKGMANIFKPLPRQHDPHKYEDPYPFVRTDTMGKYEEEEDVAMDRNSQIPKKQRFRYKLWMILHRLQGFETRFALKVIIMTSLLAVPGWMGQSRGWWDQDESWWSVAMVWIMSHPRVGGNFQDLVTRALCGILGAVWGGLAYGAGNGNPYVMAVFAAIYMLPMIYRFTQSSHPRSGIVGCISFLVVSLAEKNAEGLPSVVQIAWTRGVAFVVGVVASVMVSWILWPFIARHELRKALSAMMIYSSIIYRGVVAKYVYYERGQEPKKEDIDRSEILEGRLREGFVRIRQLMALTRHEIRLRGPFDPLPYSALIDACERFFEYLISVRESSLFFHPYYISDNEQAAESLLAYRRDAVAAILMNLYILAGALRGNRKVPRYLPSAALARKRLLDKMAEVEAAVAHSRELERIQSGGSDGEGKRWTQVYSYSYSQGLTGCVKQLEQLMIFTKEIVGQQGFDLDDDMEPTDGDAGDGHAP